MAETLLSGATVFASTLLRNAGGLREAFVEAKSLNDELYWDFILVAYETLLSGLESSDKAKRAEHQTPHVVLTQVPAANEIQVAQQKLDEAREKFKEQIPKIKEFIASVKGQNRHNGMLSSVVSLVAQRVWGTPTPLQEIKNIFNANVALLFGVQVMLNGTKIDMSDSISRNMLETLGNMTDKIVELHQNSVAEAKQREADLKDAIRRFGNFEIDVRDGLGAISENLLEIRSNLSPIQPATNDMKTLLEWVLEHSKSKGEWLLYDRHHFRYNERSDSDEPPPFHARQAAVFDGPKTSLQGFIEWIPFSSKSNQPDSEEFVREKVGRLAHIFSTKAPPPESARIPRCRAYFEDRLHGRMRYGIFFHIPGFHGEVQKGRPLDRPAEPQSLQILLSSPDLRPHPSNVQRLALIKRLMIAVHALHSLNVSHKAISSKNVLFFHANSDDAAPCEEKLHLAGFHQARDPKMVSGHIESPADLLYLPRKYIRERLADPKPTSERIYHPKYDLFGLGMVCIEIALWKSIDSLISREKEKPRDARTRFHDNFSHVKEELLAKCKEQWDDPERLLVDAIDWCLMEGQKADGDKLRGHLGGLNARIGNITTMISLLQPHGTGRSRELRQSLPVVCTDYLPPGASMIQKMHTT